MKPENDSHKLMIENLPDAFAFHRIVLDDRGTPVNYVFIEINSAFEKMTGLKREAVIGKKVTEVLPGIEKDQFDWIGIYGKIALDGGTLNFEQYSEPLKRWYKIQAYSDKPGYFVTVFIEITSHKEALATVHTLLKLSDQLIGSDLANFDYQIPANSLLKLSGAKFTAINIYEDDRSKTVTRAISGIPSAIRRASEILGFKIIGRTWEANPERLRKIEGGKLVLFRNLFETSMGALSKNQASMLQELFSIGDNYVIELAYGGRETMGDIIFFMPRGKNLQNREAIELYSGQLGVLLGRTKAERAVKEHEQELKTITDNMTDIVAIADAEGKFSYLSASNFRLLGYKPAELLGKSILELIHKDDLLKTSLLFQEAMAGGNKSARVEYRVHKKDGGYIWVETIGSLLHDHKGQPSGALFTSRDISGRKQAEEALKMQASERAAVDAFTYSVSQDLQAPLRRIEGFSEALLEECSDQLNDQARDYLERIARQIGSMKVRTDALLKLSKVVSHGINHEEVDLSVLARSCVSKLRNNEPDRLVETVVAPDIKSRGDIDLLSIVVENLLHNAWKFTVGVKNARIECGDIQKDESTTFFIRDNGVGFEQQQADKLFVPFQKLHSEADYPGIGIGLNIVYRIITRHGGKIWAEGEPGKGACFYFTLPLTTP